MRMVTVSSGWKIVKSFAGKHKKEMRIAFDPHVLHTSFNINAQPTTSTSYIIIINIITIIRNDDTKHKM